MLLCSFRRESSIAIPCEDSYPFIGDKWGTYWGGQVSQVKSWLYPDRAACHKNREVRVNMEIWLFAFVDFFIFREGCFPAVCWRHQESGAVLLRSSAAQFRRYVKYSLLLLLLLLLLLVLSYFNNKCSQDVLLYVSTVLWFF